MGAYGFGTSPPMEGPIVFIAPELTQETLLEVSNCSYDVITWPSHFLLSLQKEHNDTLAKLNFVLALVECVIEVARNRASPLAAALSESTHNRVNSKTAYSPPGTTLKLHKS